MWTFMYLFVVYFSFAPVISASIHRYVNYFDIQVLMMVTETETLMSTLHHDIFIYLDYVFSVTLYIYIYNLYQVNIYVVHSISLQTFFVQAFKVIVDSWKFSMLLLYILWDDWSIFMISGLNELLQQKLEYILLKPDCDSWWISKMQSGL